MSAPSRYTVYLHPREYARLEGIVPILQEQTIRALAEELDRLNARSPLRRWAHRLVGDSEPEIRNAAADWQVEFLADPDGDMDEGDLLVDSELVLPARPDLGVGERTRRITTVHTGRARRRGNRRSADCLRSSATSVGARIEYRRRVRAPLLRGRQGLSHDRTRRHRVPGGHSHRLVARRVAGARPHPQGSGHGSVLSDRSELARDDVQRPPHPEGLRRGRRHQTGERCGDGAAGHARG